MACPLSWLGALPVAAPITWVASTRITRTKQAIALTDHAFTPPSPPQSFRSEATISRLTLRSTLPREFFQLGILHSEPRMVDRYGNRLFIIRAKYYK